MPDIVLLNPPIIKKKIVPIRVGEHLGIAYLAAVLRRGGFKVKIVDAPLFGWTLQKTISALKKESFWLLGISVTQETYFEVNKIVKALREYRNKDIHITVGGHFPTLAYNYLLKKIDVDSIVLGEGEYRLLELARRLQNDQPYYDIEGLAYKKCNGKIAYNPPTNYIQDLNSLPYPARDTLPILLKKGGRVAISSSRGCYGSCSFCSIQSFYRFIGAPKFRARSPDNVCDEIEKLVEQNVRKFIFVDDNFLGDPNSSRARARAEEIARIIIEKNMDIRFGILCRPTDVEKGLFKILKKAGLDYVFLGVESGSPNSLKILNKGFTVKENRNAIKILRELDINVDLGFIMFHPYMTLDDVEQNLEFLEQVGCCKLPNLTSDLTVFIGTPIEKKLHHDHLIINTNDFEITYSMMDRHTEILREYILKYQASVKEIDAQINDLLERLHIEKNTLGKLHIECAKNLMNAIKQDAESRKLKKLISLYKTKLLMLLLELKECKGNYYDGVTQHFSNNTNL